MFSHSILRSIVYWSVETGSNVIIDRLVSGVAGARGLQTQQWSAVAKNAGMGSSVGFVDLWRDYFGEPKIAVVANTGPHLCPLLRSGSRTI